MRLSGGLGPTLQIRQPVLISNLCHVGLDASTEVHLLGIGELTTGKVQVDGENPFLGM